MHALLVIDMINDFVKKDGALECGARARRIVPFVRRTIEAFHQRRQLVLFVCDSHRPAAGKRLRLVEGDITGLDVEAIVNAANIHLKLGGGVAGAIRARGGPSIQEECDRLAPIGVGEAVLTGGGRLKAKYVIHAVGPVNGEGDEEAKLARATLSSLRIAADRKIRSLAFPAISTGIYGFPLLECSRIMLRVTLDFLGKNAYPREVVFCLYGKDAYEAFRKTLAWLEK
jgi:O-acetyl-ADP-ribose deacetylase (regulator of RNase III)